MYASAGCATDNKRAYPCTHIDARIRARSRAHALRRGAARRGDLLLLAQLRGLAVEEVAEPEPERELQLAAAAPDSTVSERRRTIV